MEKVMTGSQNTLHHSQDQDLTICNLIRVSHKVTFLIEFGHEGCAPDLLQFTDFDGQRNTHLSNFCRNSLGFLGHERMTEHI